MSLRFCILKEFGDALDEGEPYFLGATQTLEAARRGVEALYGVRVFDRPPR
jgi:hypothetical protein